MNISGNQLIIPVSLTIVESLKKYKIKVIHGACAGFSLKCLHNMLLLLAGAIFYS
jgi:hypothetical protein